MTSRRPAVLVVCPGRGTYNKGELGYLRRLHGDKRDLLDAMDAVRRSEGKATLRELDSRPAFAPPIHTRGDNAAPLIFAASYADFVSIDREQFDIVAVTGNSMGWYTALACAGVLDAIDAFRLADMMGGFMHEAMIGGQLLYSFVDDAWRPIPGRRDELLAHVRAIHGTPGCALYVSIDLGGMLVFAGTEPALAALLAVAPKGPGHFPLRLHNHAGFHAPLQQPVADRARAAFECRPFRAPAIPLIDGRGKIWHRHVSEPATLWDYTLGAQVIDTYDFTRAVQVAVRTFAPDHVVILGPGETLGGAVAQSLIDATWRGLSSKPDFVTAQQSETVPFVISMGRAEQRRHAVADPVAD
ncbi:hypothetical protein [Roseiterribacter gracilis]|uniref:[acyl-carrier-protein] S-malonyltransferase n=1 Tax=Roseiterribacter gracilis TaxID=2812848 RepID=A0A8S8XB84_9PROT|nr:acyl carrier protein [Rhodospirillales bacterium TMPK1]